MTRKNRNSVSDTSTGTFCLPKEAILRGRDRFNHLFERPDTILTEKHLSLRFYTTREQVGECKMGFITAKRLGKANKRNYLRRLLKEAYRLNRHSLMDAVETIPCGFYGALVGKTVAVDFNIVESETIDLLNRTVNHLHSPRDL